jgi:hypothetical protein
MTGASGSGDDTSASTSSGMTTLSSVGQTDDTGPPPTACGDGILAPGDICFGLPTLISSTPAGALRLDDFDADGNLDLAAGHDGLVSISLGNGDGTFSGAPMLMAQSGIFGLASGDVDGDGSIDLIVAESGADSVVVHLGDGAGGFAVADVLTDPGAFPRGLALGDYGGTAPLDLVVIGEESGEVTVFEGMGDGTFNPVQTIAAGLAPLSAFTTAIDEDGNDDLVVGLFGGDSVGVFWGENSGFSDVNALATGAGPRVALAADFDGDMVVDLATANQDTDDLTLHLGLGGRVFSPGQSHAVGPNPRAATVGDVDGDGRADIFVAIELANAVGVLRSTAAGLDPIVTVQTFPRPSAIAVGDLNGDGAPDLVTGNPGGDGGIAVVLAQP